MLEHDRIRRAGVLAVAAEDAAQHIDLVRRRIALAGRVRLLRVILGRDDQDRVGRAGGRAERTADAALLAVGETLQLVLAAEALAHRALDLGVLYCDRLLE